MSTETAQINARINRTLKERGDAALERAGFRRRKRRRRAQGRKGARTETGSRD